MDDDPIHLIRAVLDELQAINKVLQIIAVMLALMIGAGIVAAAKAGMLHPWFNSLFGS